MSRGRARFVEGVAEQSQSVLNRNVPQLERIFGRDRISMFEHPRDIQKRKKSTYLAQSRHPSWSS